MEKRKRWWALGIVLLGLMFFATGCLEPAPPRMAAAAIGVSDLERSVDFYTRIVGMTEKGRIVDEDKTQVVLAFEESIGSDLILMNYTDGSNPNYAYNPDKVVFYVPDAYALADAIAAEGFRILTPPAPQAGLEDVVVGMAMDPDGYWVEMVQDPSVTYAYFGAVGIGVSDLEASADFYTRVLGMTEQYRLNIPNLMDEVILQYPHEGGGSGVVLMHFVAPKNYKDLPIKLTYKVTDFDATMAAIDAEGLEILSGPETKGRKSLKSYGLAKDPDGYLLEIMPSLQRKSDASDDSDQEPAGSDD